MSMFKIDINLMKSEIDSLRARVAELSDCLNTIVAEYNSPPYTELDWITWKQRAEKALANSGKGEA